MIKFFRKIRQRLLTENKFSKYLLYAIGEIALVMIGILLALQVNNWNESKKESKIRKNYYEQILQDLAKDTTQINKELALVDSNIIFYENYKENLPEKETISLVLREFGKFDWTYNIITFNTNTTESLLSTGDIKLMPDKIRNALLDLKNSQHTLNIGLNSNYKTFRSSSRKAFSLGMVNALLDFHPNLKDSINRVEDKILLLNTMNEAFQLKYFTEYNTSRSLKSNLESIEGLAELINEELNK